MKSRYRAYPHTKGEKNQTAEQPVMNRAMIKTCFQGFLNLVCSILLLKEV